MGKSIDILGLGAGDLDQLPLGVYKKLIKAECNKLFILFV